MVEKDSKVLIVAPFSLLPIESGRAQRLMEMCEFMKQSTFYLEILIIQEGRGKNNLELLDSYFGRDNVTIHYLSK